MLNLNITRVQIEYLLFIQNYEGNKTITEASNYFNCSRVNSKKILDRMVVVGVLYKENNEYKLTQVGKDLSNIYNENLEKNIYILEKFLELDEEVARDVSYEILAKRIGSLQDALDRRYKFLKFSKNLKEKTRISNISELIGEGSYDIGFNIKKVQYCSDKSFVEDSMALRGFESYGKLVIEQKSYIELYAKTVKKAQDGYNRKGIATKLYYFKNNEEFEIESKEKTFKIPLDIIDYWSTSDGIILESSIILTIKSQLGMKNHVKKANFIFYINLCLI
ncbi:hypothetical protein KQI68_06300 [Peptoniphilus sp. MSJ-1]|uniref:Manganese transport regulator MntR n=1 Tax=Peptoniphilus ovalis TaxID=2841503 RepID=A0ABS6FGZ5_9FIRM|nr:hypothetical protein [Peptoniphilus ovalis]MBU5669447.1 hypothetical protein [Peptoniphilus ovalis]